MELMGVVRGMLQRCRVCILWFLVFIAAPVLSADSMDGLEPRYHDDGGPRQYPAWLTWPGLVLLALASAAVVFVAVTKG